MDTTLEKLKKNFPAVEQRFGLRYKPKKEDYK
jgi:hypothetical protein